MTASDYKPEQYSRVTPYLLFQDAGKAMDFYKEALAAEEVMRLPGPDGVTMHGEIRIGEAHIMMGSVTEATPSEWKGKTVEDLGASPVSFYVYYPDVEAAFDHAIRAGMKEKSSIKEQFWGDKMGILIDPFGYEWSLAQKVRDMSPEEMNSAMCSAKDAA